MTFLGSIGCCEIVNYPNSKLTYKITPIAIAYSEMSFEEFKKHIDKHIIKKELKWYQKEDNIKWMIDKIFSFKSGLILLIFYFTNVISGWLKAMIQAYLQYKSH